MNEEDQLDELDAIGEAWLDDDGTIRMHLKRTGDGQHVNALLAYPKGDPNYEKVLMHLNGLKQGEKKLVPAWND